MTMPRSPGVYVQEVPSAVQPIAGVGTSTAGFIGVFRDPAATPGTMPPLTAGDRQTRYALNAYPVNPETVDVKVGGRPDPSASVVNDDGRRTSFLVLARPPAAGTAITATYDLLLDEVSEQRLAPRPGEGMSFRLKHYPVEERSDQTVQVERRTSLTTEEDNGDNRSPTITLPVKPLGSEFTVTYTVETGTEVRETIQANKGKGEADLTFDLKIKELGATVPVQVIERAELKTGVLRNGPDGAATLTIPELTGDVTVSLTYRVPRSSPLATAAPGEVRLCTSFGDFTRAFGGFAFDPGQRALAHAVYGFFNNGGSRCYVTRVAQRGDVPLALERFETVDEIAIVAAPGINDDAVWAAITAHCERMGDRFAILDGPERLPDDRLDVLNAPAADVLPRNSNYAAYYFPWLQVYDPFSDSRIYVPPSGHMAGIYARVDNQRGVHKAPANEVVLGALGLRYQLSRAQQDGLNPQGVNCIRELNGNIRVWGARTLGGDAHGEWKYINVRRLFLFLRESIDEGTQWAVFEPNDTALWAKITRNVTAFLTNVWRAGALFGNTPQEAFYVKCDASTNPPDVRELGQVVTEIGVAVTRPAEFVVFRISQWARPGE